MTAEQTTRRNDTQTRDGIGQPAKRRAAPASTRCRRDFCGNEGPAHAGACSQRGPRTGALRTPPTAADTKSDLQLAAMMAHSAAATPAIRARAAHRSYVLRRAGTLGPNLGHCVTGSTSKQTHQHISSAWTPGRPYADTEVSASSVKSPDPHHRDMPHHSNSLTRPDKEALMTGVHCWRLL
jgi:hypothetical protein